MTTKRSTTSALATSSVVLLASLFAPAIGTAAPSLHFANACPETVRLWVKFQEAGRWRTMGGWYFESGVESPIADAEKHAVLEGEAFFFYADAPSTGEVWDGPIPATHEGVVLGMRRRNVTASEGVQSLVLCGDDAHQTAVTAPPPSPPAQRSWDVAFEAECTQAISIDLWVVDAQPHPTLRQLSVDPTGESRTTVTVQGDPTWSARATRKWRQSHQWSGPQTISIDGRRFRMSNLDPNGPRTVTLACPPLGAVPPLGARVLVTDAGLQIVTLRADGPARREEMRIGDVVTHVDGVPVETLATLRQAMKGRRPLIQYERNGEITSVRVKPDRK